MFHDVLNKYKVKGSFTYKPFESLKEKCNAPTDKGGVYLIFKIIEGQEILIYIGSSGQRNSDGTLKVRNGGMKDRLVNGYHPNRFGVDKRIKRQNAFPQQMLKEGIPELKFYWWVTYDDDFKDFPTDVETLLRSLYIDRFKRLPYWHK